MTSVSNRSEMYQKCCWFTLPDQISFIFLFLILNATRKSGVLTVLPARQTRPCEWKHSRLQACVYPRRSAMFGQFRIPLKSLFMLHLYLGTLQNEDYEFYSKDWSWRPEYKMILNKNIFTDPWCLALQNGGQVARNLISGRLCSIGL